MRPQMRTYIYITIILLSICTYSCGKSEIVKIGKNEEVKGKRDFKNYIRVQELSNYIATAQHIRPVKTDAEPFADLSYNKIIAYDYEGDEEHFNSIIQPNGKFTIVVTDQKELNQNQADNLVSLLTNSATYGEGFASCFIPHLAFVFYNDLEVVFKVDVCLDCNHLISSSEIPAMKENKINEGTEYEYHAIGFSLKGKQNIKKLSKELDFYYGSNK